MKLINFPIESQESSINVANLQSALSIMLPTIGAIDFKIPAAELAAQKALDGTREAIKMLQDKFPNNYNQDSLVDELMAKLINDFVRNWFTINGRLTDLNGQGLSDYIILTSEYEIDRMSELGLVLTNPDGSFTFSFRYEAKLPEGNTLTTPDLFFKIRGAFGQLGLAFPLTKNPEAVFVVEDGIETPVPRLAEFEKAPLVLMNCPQEMEVRIIVATAQSNFTIFERLIIQLSPFMRQTNFADLKEDEQNFQISFLSKKTDIQKSIIENLKYAFVNEQNSNLPAWAFFGLSISPLPISEWNSKTTEEFIALLQTFKPATSVENLSTLTEKLMAYANSL